MNVRTIFSALGPIDARNVFRDGSLKWMFFLPLLSALMLRWGVPPLTRWLMETQQFDFVPYYPAGLAYFFVVMCPITFGVLTGFLLIDEKDDQTLIALQVTPLPINKYLAYRVTVPVSLTLLLMFVLFPLSGLGGLDWSEILLTGIVSAPMAPMFALFLASIAQNKVQGFALMKLSGMVLFLPIFAFFIDSSWRELFGIIPTYWPMRVYWMLEAGESGVWPYALIAVVFQSGLTWLLARRFDRVLHR